MSQAQFPQLPSRTRAQSSRGPPPGIPAVLNGGMHHDNAHLDGAINPGMAGFKQVVASMPAASEAPRFDLQSDFPALGGAAPSNDKSHAAHQEFAMEDFPALGSTTHASSGSFDFANAQQSLASSPSLARGAVNTAQRPLSGQSGGILSQPAAGSIRPPGSLAPTGANQPASQPAPGQMPMHFQQPPYNQNPALTGGAPRPNPGPVSRPSSGAPHPHPGSQAAAGLQPTIDAGKYGLSGLLNVIRMTDTDLNTLALGVDLTNLGLNLNSTDLLYATFAYPCSDSPLRKDPDYVLPYCYYMQPPALKTSHLAKFSPETLFYIFYNMPKDTLQVFAAKELYNRGWKYHKDMQLWFAAPTEENLKTLGQDPKTGAAAAGAAGASPSVPGASNAGAKPPGAVAANAAAATSPETHIYFDIETWQRKLYTNVSGAPLQFLQQEVIATL